MFVVSRSLIVKEALTVVQYLSNQWGPALIALFFIVIASSFVSVQPAFAEEPAGQETFDAVVGEAADLIEQLHIPGLSVGVIHEANSYAAGIGVTNVITREPVTADTTFYRTSVTKTFTATLAMMQSEQRVLDLNAQIVDILPWFRVKDPEATAKAHVIDMSHHHTGWSGDHGFDPVPPGGSITEKCMLQARYIEQIVPFGQAWMYSNTNLAITGTLHSVSLRHVPRYLAEFEYRFNRRYHLEDMIERLTFASARTPPMPLPAAQNG